MGNWLGECPEIEELDTSNFSEKPYLGTTGILFILAEIGS
jgi:hypothetical protein